MKRYLLLAGYDYYPAYSTGDWVGCYETVEEAEEVWNKMKDEEYPCEWHEIVDLMEWME